MEPVSANGKNLHIGAITGAKAHGDVRTNRSFKTAGVLAVGLLGACGGSAEKSTTDAGITCKKVTNDAGFQDCSPGCELKNVSTGDAAGVATCVPKPVAIDASPVDLGSSEANESETNPLVGLDGSAPIDLGSGVDATFAPTCSNAKKARAYVDLGSAYTVNGTDQCPAGGPGKIDNGDLVTRTTESGAKETGAAKVTTTPSGTVVEIAFPSFTLRATENGCTQTAGGVTSQCSDANTITVTGATTVPAYSTTRSVLSLTVGGQTYRFALNNDGTVVANAGGSLTSLGVGDDGKDVVAGQVNDTLGTTTCGTAVAATPAQMGGASAALLASETDVRPSSKFTATLTFNQKDFPGVSEGDILNLGSSMVQVVEMVANGAKGAVVVSELNGQKRACVILAGEGSDTACNASFNGKPLVVKFVNVTNSCPASLDAGTKDVTANPDASVTPDAPAAETSSPTDSWSVD